MSPEREKAGTRKAEDVQEKLQATAKGGGNRREGEGK